ncbi:hypothetical protein AURDEDRAFT_166375 [Auricularia subglabra TFB-10046 SS5]|uniref:Uncharacterized protein n=1 Tax=Auricularia subglabra (strain TFB-10046 / SS5) TaxID=717982 RepID=J0WXR8_AURST|nr:hypothetical protein AURDEDRAFT_166375 [Auricularia subglabra TFB-10046 SS5]
MPRRVVKPRAQGTVADGGSALARIIAVPEYVNVVALYRQLMLLDRQQHVVVERRAARGRAVEQRQVDPQAVVPISAGYGRAIGSSEEGNDRTHPPPKERKAGLHSATYVF